MKEEITKYYDDLASDYDRDRFDNSYGQYIHQQEIKIVSKYLSENKSELNLDLASGTGRFLKYADYGIDISPKMVEVAKKKYPQKKLTIEDAESLSFQNSFFNNVLAFHLFMHLDASSVRTILDETSRVLKKEGYFIFDIPSEKRRKLFRYKSATWHGGNQISVRGLKELCGAQFDLVSCYGTAFFPIHRLPVKLRKLVLRVDSFMCRTFLKEYSSHLVFVLRKK